VQLVQSEKRVTLTVQDHGCGFEVNSVKAGLGLKSIRSRISEFGGNVEFFSEKGHGSEINIEFKIKK
jgi:signal transduction histidine kinase